MSAIKRILHLVFTRRIEAGFSTWRRLLAATLGIVCLLAASAANAGVLGEADLQQYFPDAIRIGPKDDKIPVWPIVKLDGPKETVVAYAFESIDLAPIPGFAGTPFNLLVVIDRNGQFLEVHVLSQHEPVFLDGLGPEPLFKFVEQYKGKRLLDNIRVAQGPHHHGDTELDGVTKATASVRILNESVLASALKVARAKLGFAQAASSNAATVRQQVFAPMDWQQLVDAGYVVHFRATNADAEKLFRGTVGEGTDPLAQSAPDAACCELWIAYLNVPTIGRNLLGEKAWQRLMGSLEPGQHALLVASSGRIGFIDDSFVRGAVPERLAVRQGGLPITIRDLDIEPRLQAAGAPKFNEMLAFRIIAQTGFDPSRPWQLLQRLTRKKGVLLPEQVDRELSVDYKLPEKFFDIPESQETRAWKGIWKNRAEDLALLAGGLVLLTAALFGQRWLVAKNRRLPVFRWAFLSFTLIFVGWLAQGQLSIVNLTGPLMAWRQGRSLSFVLYDPVTLLVTGFTLLSLPIWGRGTFCGWLCPFGALQEFVGKAAQALRLPQLRIPEKLERRLGLIKYLVLFAILASAILMPALTDRLVEAEPFKTAITLIFVRSGPAFWYALATLALGAFVYKGYCRWICPLGAALALLGRTRRWNWLPRRAECGSPCQRCRNECEYQAIEPSGAIHYADCFQCLDCVAIHDDRKRCVPLILMDRHGQPVPLGGKAARAARETGIV